MISKKQVQHIAELARISLTDKEILKFQTELSSILDYMEKLKKANTKEIESVYQGLVRLSDEKIQDSLLRKDESKPQDKKVVQELIDQVPQEHQGCIRVKPILKSH